MRSPTNRRRSNDLSEHRPTAWRSDDLSEHRPINNRRSNPTCEYLPSHHRRTTPLKVSNSTEIQFASISDHIRMVSLLARDHQEHLERLKLSFGLEAGPHHLTNGCLTVTTADQPSEKQAYCCADLPIGEAPLHCNYQTTIGGAPLLRVPTYQSATHLYCKYRPTISEAALHRAIIGATYYFKPRAIIGATSALSLEPSSGRSYYYLSPEFIGATFVPLRALCRTIIGATLPHEIRTIIGEPLHQAPYCASGASFQVQVCSIASITNQQSTSHSSLPVLEAPLKYFPPRKNSCHQLVAFPREIAVI